VGVGREPERASRSRLAFRVIDAKDINAFAAPGATSLSQGLYLVLQSEGELAGVLAHEVGHVIEETTISRSSSKASWWIWHGAPGQDGG